MAAATNAQVQEYVDSRVRNHSLLIVQLYRALKDDKANLDDVYANLTASNPSTTWTDGRTTNPAHLATPSDVLAWNGFVTNMLAMIEGDASWPIVQKLLVNPLV